ncbi:hypothetical protein BCR34DRAFT_619992 [Clohesyomyces aquaticus]|uniref:Uncharacterized protein n=1 Tax=Clohesyomyces aquaticus TaxID=1231657 RepID=A0A1Y1YAR5_9PLEO|nr:hypothetical protein BCR34DRAFT_619992 [Clohesyomyces aquaticus]
MATPPPDTASSTFDQTWHETDAAFLDPTSLPVAKVPRAWERKQETKITRDGKQKKVWRRYTLRSQHTSSATTEDDDVEAQTPHARPVKKLRVRLEGMEQTSVKFQGQGRAFKNTQWDRRKSGLTRKRPTSRRSSVKQMADTNESPEEVEVTLAEARHEDSSESDENDANDAKDTLEIDATVSDLTELQILSKAAEQLFGGESATSDAPSTVDIPPNSPVKDEEDVTVQAVANSPEKEAIVVIELAEDLSAPSEEMECHEADVHRVFEFHEKASKDTAEIPYDSDMNHNDDTRADADADAEENYSPAEDEPHELPVSGEGELLCAVESSPHPEPTNIVDLPTPGESLNPSAPDLVDTDNLQQDAEMSEITLGLEGFFPEPESDAAEEELQDPEEDSELIEENLQLELQKDMEMTPNKRFPEAQTHSQELEGVLSNESANNGKHALETLDVIILEQEDSITETQTGEDGVEGGAGDESNDIAAGLTLALFQPSTAESAERKLQSPAPAVIYSGGDDQTAALPMDDDTALLKDFLTRAAASKANKSTAISRRSSLQNRRDSGAIRQALASPRKILEDKDPNSPSKFDNEVTLDLSQTLTLNIGERPPLSPTSNQADPEGTEGTEGTEDDAQSLRSSRRSSRTRKSRLPQFSSTPQPVQTPKNISLRRTDGGEPVVLKRTEAQELGLLTRANTRKNKQGAVAVSLRLLKLSTANALSTPDDAATALEAKLKKKNVRWDEKLAYFQEGTTQTLESVLSHADLESLATPEELSLPISTPSVKSKPKTSKDRSSTPRVRRLRGLGAANGTPGKGLLAPASLLPTEVQEEKEACELQSVPKPSKIKKIKIAPTATDAALQAPTTESRLPLPGDASVGIEPTAQVKGTSVKERKSRLATPKKVKLHQPQPQIAAPQVPGDGKENQQNRSFGIPTPKMGLSLPRVVVPPVVETGLPRRRAGRKL